MAGAHEELDVDELACTVADATKALQLDPNNVDALLKKGVACYHLREYATAAKALEHARSLEPDNSAVQEWLAKCSHAQASPSAPTAPAPAPAQAPPAGTSAPLRVRHDWYQTPTDVYVSVMLKKVQREDVSVEFGRQSLSVDVQLPGAGAGRSYTLELDLAGLIVPDQCSWQVFATKIEIRMHKEANVKWDTLEWTGEQDAAPKPMDVAPAGPSAASALEPLPQQQQQQSQGAGHGKRGPRDWDRLVSEIKEDEKEEEKDLNGDAAINNLFQKIYASADEDTRRAMNKSFVESGGTVLSTNWKEIGAKKVEVRPPDGMEPRTFSE